MIDDDESDGNEHGWRRNLTTEGEIGRERRVESLKGIVNKFDCRKVIITKSVMTLQSIEFSDSSYEFTYSCNVYQKEIVALLNS